MPSNNADYNKKYYADNKDRMLALIKQNSTIIIQCPICHTGVRKSSMVAHRKTKLHQYIANHQVNITLNDA